MSDLLKAFGILGILAGAYYAVTGFMTGIYVSTGPNGVVSNLGLAADRTDTLAFGGFLLVAGSVLLVGGYLGDRLNNVARRAGRTEIEREDADA